MGNRVGNSFTWRAADHADDSDGHFEPGGVAQHEADEHEEGERVSRTPTRWRGFGMLKVNVGQWSLTEMTRSVRTISKLEQYFVDEIFCTFTISTVLVVKGCVS